MRVSFGGFEVDTTTYELRNDGEPVGVEPQVFEVLAHLVRHRDRVVTKEELLDEVWGDRFVSESALTSRIKHVRRALGDDGQRQELVRTVHGRGYRFVAEVTMLEDTDGASSGPVGAEVSARHNLPADRTPLVGRADEIADTLDLIGANRLVTLLGIGGVGKTRLATAVGRAALEHHPDGVWFVDLVPAGGEGSVETAIAHDLGLAVSTGDARPQLARLLDSRRALIVLDNCEHVRDEVVSVLDHLLAHTTAPRFLTTSREPLDLPDERRMAVGPLPVGDWAAPATMLFRASAERVGATVGPDELPTIERICRHLDGLPLAIELAAAQLRVLHPSEVADRLDERFELLHEPHRPGRARHTSLMAVLEDTWDLLDKQEQELAGRLASFAGAFSLVDVEQLCDDLARGVAARTLAGLVDRSLVVSLSGDERRFRLLETVRLFASSRTDGDDHAERHLRWCQVQLGDTLTENLFDFRVATWCATHYDDVRAAERRLAHARRRREAARLLAGTGLAMHCDTGARAADVLTEIGHLLGELDDVALAARLHITGVLCGMATRSPETMALHGTAALEAAGATDDAVLQAVALVHASWATVLDHPEQALAMVEEASSMASAQGHRMVRKLADSYRAYYLAWLRRYDEAIDQAHSVAGDPPLSEGAGQESFVAVTMLAACDAVGRPELARGWIDALVSLPSPAEPMWGNLVVSATILASVGEVREAVELVDRVRRELQAAGQDWLPDLLVPAAALAHHLGEDELARRWVRAVRDAGRPTQSFQVTCAYRRLRQVTGIADDPVLDGSTLEAVGADALDWMHSRRRLRAR